MKTFILLTFGFLGFAFYEMSGGSEFEPARERFAEQTATSVEAPAPAVAPAQTALVQPAPATPTITAQDDAPEVTRVALNLVSVNDTGVQARVPAPQTARIIDSSDTPQIILPSLIATTGTEASFEPRDDIRTVSGNRVNVRGGPSTNFGVVGKLTRGDDVRILEDNGDGWVRMEALDGGDSGWMADFLLTSG
ncbi:MAG: SH3 domain-containing protein [Sulfitobacter sp.]